LRRRRCLIPCNGFYEWKPLPARPGAKPRKQPIYIRRRDDRVFALAGLWDRWENPEGIAVDSFTILTTEPNELMRDLHNRMPVVVRRSDYALWLDPEIQDVQRLSTLFAPVPADDFSAYPVGTVVNNAAHDSPDCIRPIA
jgi:putative SOS response-associated peptidase YedK